MGNATRDDEGEKACVGGQGREGPPGSIPNPEVKLTSADGTARATAWESKPLPTLVFSLSSYSVLFPPNNKTKRFSHATIPVAFFVCSRNKK